MGNPISSIPDTATTDVKIMVNARLITIRLVLDKDGTDVEVTGTFESSFVLPDIPDGGWEIFELGKVYGPKEDIMTDLIGYIKTNDITSDITLSGVWIY